MGHSDNIIIGAVLDMDKFPIIGTMERLRVHQTPLIPNIYIITINGVIMAHYCLERLDFEKHSQFLTNVAKKEVYQQETDTFVLSILGISKPAVFFQYTERFLLFCIHRLYIYDVMILYNDTDEVNRLFSFYSHFFEHMWYDPENGLEEPIGSKVPHEPNGRAIRAFSNRHVTLDDEDRLNVSREYYQENIYNQYSTFFLSAHHRQKPGWPEDWIKDWARPGL